MYVKKQIQEVFTQHVGSVEDFYHHKGKEELENSSWWVSHHKYQSLLPEKSDYSIALF